MVRYVARRYDYLLKGLLAHKVTALRRASIRLIIFVAAVFNMQLIIHDVTEAYLQSKHNLLRQIYLRPKEGGPRVS